MRGPLSSPLRILVVDDNVDAAASLALILEAWGHEVRQTHDGPSALEAAQDFQPDTVFLDIGLPRMDGFEVAQRLRSLPGLGRTFLVAASGFNRDKDLRRASEVGIDLYLGKPLNPWQLQPLLTAQATSSEAVPA